MGLTLRNIIAVLDKMNEEKDIKAKENNHDIYMWEMQIIWKNLITDIPVKYWFSPTINQADFPYTNFHTYNNWLRFENNNVFNHDDAYALSSTITSLQYATVDMWKTFWDNALPRLSNQELEALKERTLNFPVWIYSLKWNHLWDIIKIEYTIWYSGVDIKVYIG